MLVVFTGSTIIAGLVAYKCFCDGDTWLGYINLFCMLVTVFCAGLYSGSVL